MKTVNPLKAVGTTQAPVQAGVKGKIIKQDYEYREPCLYPNVNPVEAMQKTQ